MKILDASIILVRPQLPENIGMVARAMQNCGLKKLILVSPREKWPNKIAFDASANANIIIKKTKVFDSINAALSPFHYVIATSSRNRFLYKIHQSNFPLLFKKIPSNKNIAIVFGPENSGLSNEDLLLCDIIFSINLSKKNQSLNLSHSVLLMAYKWKEYFSKSNDIRCNKKTLSTKKDFNFFMNFLKQELIESGFLLKKEKSLKFNNIQSMFLRAKLSKTEIQTLWGMIKKLKNPSNK